MKRIILIILAALSAIGTADEITGLNLRTAAGSQAVNPTAVAGAVLTLDANKRPVFSSGLTAPTATGSVTGSASTSFLDMSGTWNTSGTPTGLKLNITDTASNASSLLADFQVGGVSKAAILKGGHIRFGPATADGGQLMTGINPGWISLKNGDASNNGKLEVRGIYAYDGVSAGSAFQADNSFGVRVLGSKYIAWCDISVSNAPDLILSRAAAANLRLGDDASATPVSQTLSVQNASGTNIAGAALYIDGSQSTGSGQGGSIVFRTSAPGGGGTGQNPLTKAVSISYATDVYSGLTGGCIFGGNIDNQAILFGQSNDMVFRCGSTPIAYLSFDQGIGIGQWSGGSRTWRIYGCNAGNAANRAAETLKIDACIGTGNGAGGYLHLRAAPSTGSGSAAHVLEDVMLASVPTSGSPMVAFGGKTASSPALKRSGTTLQVRLADDSAYAPIAASTVSAGGTAVWSSGAGSPEGVVTAAVGSLYTRTDGGAATTLYVKESGAGNTGWVATGAATGGGTKTIARFFPADNEPPTANFATLDTRNSHPVLDFDTTTQETAIFREFIPEGASLTNGVTVYIQWAATSATSGTVGWDVSFERVDTTLDLDADNFGAAQTVTAASVSGTSGVSSNTSVNFTQAQLPASLAAGEMYRVRVRRDVANDTATGDAELLGVEIRLQ